MAVRLLLAVSVFSVSGLAAGWAQARGNGEVGRLSGVVLSSEGGPISEVEIYLPGTTIRGSTSVDGRFVIEQIPTGPRVVVFRKIGFRPEAINVLVVNEPRVLGQVLLDPGPYQLPEISVSAKYAKPERYSHTTKYDEFYRRRKVGGGIFLDRERLDQRLVMNTYEVFQGLSGVHVDVRPAGVGSKLWFARCNESPPAIGVWVDGVRLLPPWGISAGYGVSLTNSRQGTSPNAATSVSDVAIGSSAADDSRTRFVDELVNSVSPADIEAIEVYKGPAGLPGEFNQGDNCGAIVIWTRQGGVRRTKTDGEARF